MIFAAADFHLGQGAHLSPTRLAEQEAVFNRFLLGARARSAEAAIIAGDLFDRRRPTPDEILAAERPLVAHRDIGGCPVIVINGNHDVQDLESRCGLDVLAEAGLIELHRQPGVTMLERSGTMLALLPWAPVSLLRTRLDDVPADQVNTAAADMLVQVARDLFAQTAGALYAGLVTHFSIEGGQTPAGLVAEPHVFREPVLSAVDLSMIGYDFTIAGHLHAPMRLAGLASSPIVYCGSPMPLNFGEGGCEHGYWEIDQSGIGTEFVPVESPRFVTLTLDDMYQGEYADMVQPGDYVRLKDTTSEEGHYAGLLDDFTEAAYTKVEVTVERAARARVVIEDESADPFGLWAAANEIEGDVLAELAALDTAYREKAIA